MKPINISDSDAYSVNCTGHPSLIFDETTTVCGVVYVTIITKDGMRHPFTILVTDEEKVEEAINDLQQSYQDQFEDIEEMPLVPIKRQ